MALDEPRLQIRARAVDVAERRRLAAVLVGALGLLLATQWGSPKVWPPAWWWVAAQLLALGALLWASAMGLWTRGRALLGVGRLRRDGLRASELLTQGDLPGAKAALEDLLVRGRTLGAFHAAHVMLWGVLRFFEGATEEGLALVNRALASGWFDSPRGQPLKLAGQAWRVLMLLDLGRLEEARARLDQGEAGRVPSVTLALAACEGRWQAVLDGATQALDDGSLSERHRPTVAMLGLRAARALQHPASARFQALLAQHPVLESVRLNPVYRRFLEPPPAN